MCENRFMGLGVGRWKNPEKRKPSKHCWCAVFHIRGKENPWEIVTKLCQLVDIREIIMYAAFGADRLRGLGVARGQISNFLIDFRHRPYNTRTTARVCDCKIRSRDLTTPTLWLNGHAMANICFAKCGVSTFNRSEDISWFQILQKGHVTQTTSR